MLEQEPQGSFFVGGGILLKTIALANQKGGVGKTTTAASLGIGLSRQGKKVLLIDADAQGNLTQMLGWSQPDELSPTLSTLMEKVIAEKPIAPGEGILHHPSGVHLVPANIELSALEVTLVNTMSRETVLRQYLSTVADRYDYALIDCMPSLGMLTINALTAADSVIIPVQAQYLPAKGLEQLLRTITRVKRQLNPKLEVDGILLTMVDSRTTLAREINALIRKSYGGHVFTSEIPRSIKAAEISVENKSIYDHDRSGKVAVAYVRLNKLIPPLLDAVDTGTLKFVPAADFISHLSEKEQTYLLLVMERDEVSPSLGQAQRLKQLSAEGKLENNIIDLIMREEKPLERKVTIRNDRLQKYFPASYTPKQMEEVIIKLLEGWHRKRQQEQAR